MQGRAGRLPVADAPRVEGDEHIHPLVVERGHQGHEQQHQAGERHRQGEHLRRGPVYGVDRTAEAELQGRHGRVVHARYGGAEDHRGNRAAQRRLIPACHEEGGGRDADRDQIGQGDQAPIVAQRHGAAQGRHADVVHEADPSAHDHASADDPRRPPAALLRQHECPQRRQHRQHERQEGQAWVVADRRARIETQHGDEVHRPDAGPHRHCGDDQPGGASAAYMGADPPEQVQRGPGPGRRHQDREDHIERTVSVVHRRKLRGLRPERQALCGRGLAPTARPRYGPLAQSP